MRTKALAAVAFLVLPALIRVGAQEPAPDKSKLIAVNVLGEVGQPGRYLLPPGATVLDALAAAGGPSLEANLKQVRCIHATGGDEPSVDKIDMKAVLAGTKVALVLHGGDSLMLSRKFVSIVY